MSSFNKIILSGRLTQEPEVRYTPQGTAVATLNMAVDDHRRSGKETDFFYVTVFGKQAELAGAHLVKGQGLIVDGRLKLKKWQGEEGPRSRLEIYANRVQFGMKPKGAVPVAA